MDREDQAMPEGKTGDAVQKRHDRRTRVEALVGLPPGLQRTTGHVKSLGRLTLGHPLGFEIALALKPLRAFEAIPALVAIGMATLRVWDSCSHSSLLFKPHAWEKDMAQDDEVALLLPPFTMSRR
jgi:hypothetical protein